MKHTFVDTFSTGAAHGQYLRDFSEFEEETPWADPAFKAFFKYATVNSNMEKSEFIFDLFTRTLAGFILMVISPLLLAIAVGIKITMPGSIFFQQVRVGRNGKLFKVIKFRTMVENAEEHTGHTLSWDGDPRITQFGEFLRKSHLDELPQLINVLLGDMYFIGPRPERPEFTSVYEQTVMGYNDRHVIKPGITGLAQIACKYDATANQKLKFDLMYIALKDSFILNSLIALHTVKKMIFLKSTADLLK